jgi:hypothetical protein
MIKKLVIALLCFASYAINAQNTTISPYSFFGIGDLSKIATVDNQMMGRLQTYADSIHINLNNPAAYGKLRITTYSAALSHREIRLETFTAEQKSSVTNLEYLSIGFPLNDRWGAGFGLMPYSSVGYNLLDESSNSNGAAVLNEYSGQGGLNKVYFSLGYRLLGDLYLGATMNYNFGNLTNQRIQSVENVQFGTLDRRESRVNGFDFNYGATYTPKITPKHTLFSSVTVNTQANLISENLQRIGSFSRASGDEIEVVEVNLAARGLDRTEIKVPTTTTLGLGYGEDKKWFVGAEYSFQAMSDFRNEFVNVEDVAYQDASSFGLGAFFVPDYTSFTSYLKRVTYRAGLRLDKTGMVVRGSEINNFGITFGLGLPLGIRGFSNLNLGVELGRRGTTVANLVEENYLKVNVGLSLSDKWFVKRRVD